MRLRRAAVVLLTGALAGTTGTPAGSSEARPASTQSPPTPAPVGDSLLNGAAEALLASAVPTPVGGLAWRSVIQAPHLQTDRDVGAASVAFGLLAAYDVTKRPAYLLAARRAGDFLLSAQVPAGSGRWPDYVDPGHTAGYAFTSFDDGAAGIADLLWRLWEHTGDRRYRAGALAGMGWLERSASGLAGRPCPQLCRWAWTDPPRRFGPVTYTGMGEGIAGIVWAFSAFAERTGDPSYERYAEGGARYLASLVTPEGALPEQPGIPGYDTGYLSGAAGDAFCFLRMYRRTGDPHYLALGRLLLHWVRARAVPDRDALAWPIEVRTPNGRGGNPQRATGVEEGAAGIAWVELQAYAVTGDLAYLQTATAAGQWLLASAWRDRGGLAWPEDEGRALVHTSLDNGAPGIGVVLDDLGRATGQARFAQAAAGARAWITAVARHRPAGPYWYEHRSHGHWTLPADPSWHWGTAGIIGFLARLDGWRLDVPGEEPGLLETL